ncbi:MAG: hypothetical protein RQM95_08875 [Syntrophaceticus schinkii]
MDFEMQEQIAAFRYGLIAPIVSRQSPMLPGELKHLLEEIASRTYTIPGSHRTTVSTRTLERYIANYRRAGWEWPETKAVLQPTEQASPFRFCRQQSIFAKSVRSAVWSRLSFY